MPGSRSVRTGEKGKQAAKKAREQQRTASDRLSPRYFALFFFDPFPQSLGAWNRLMNSLCAVWGWVREGGVKREILLPFSLPSCYAVQRMVAVASCENAPQLKIRKRKLSMWITPLCTLLCHHCTTTTWNCLNSRFMEDKTTIFVFKLKYSPLEFNSTTIHHHLTTWTWNIRAMNFLKQREFILLEAFSSLSSSSWL